MSQRKSFHGKKVWCFLEMIPNYPLIRIYGKCGHGYANTEMRTWNCERVKRGREKREILKYLCHPQFKLDRTLFLLTCLYLVHQPPKRHFERLGPEETVTVL